MTFAYRFNPDVLFNTGSSCFGLLIFEFLIFRGGLLFFNAEAPPKLDSFAITGYKFVSCVLYSFSVARMLQFECTPRGAAFVTTSDCAICRLYTLLVRSGCPCWSWRTYSGWVRSRFCTT